MERYFVSVSVVVSAPILMFWKTLWLNFFLLPIDDSGCLFEDEEDAADVVVVVFDDFGACNLPLFNAAITPGL